MKNSFLVLVGLGLVAIGGWLAVFLAQTRIVAHPLAKPAQSPVVVAQSSPLAPDSGVVNLPECAGFLDGTLLGKNGVQAAAIALEASGDFTVPDAQMGNVTEIRPNYALFKDGRVIELETGGAREGDGCEADLMRELSPKQKGLDVGSGAEVMLMGTAADAEHVHWYPLQAASSELDPLALLKPCEGMPKGAVRSKTLSIYEAHAPLTGKLVHFEWVPTSAAPDCDGYGSVFAYLPADGSCQIFQMSPYECLITDSLSVLGDAVGVVEFSVGADQEDLLILGLAGYESRTLISLPVSKDGKVGLSSCGGLFAGGC